MSRSIQPSLFMPQTEWVVPDSLKDLSKYDEIAVDLETNDPDLTTKGSGNVTGKGHVVGVAIAVDTVGVVIILLHMKMVATWIKTLLYHG